MKNTIRMKLAGIGCAILFAALPAAAQEHKWAGRTLNGIEWRIHEELATLPFHGVFDTLRFEMQGKTVTLSGQAVRESVKANAEAAVARIEGVERVVNQIEILPSSARGRGHSHESVSRHLSKPAAGEVRHPRNAPDSHHRQGRRGYTRRSCGFGGGPQAGLSPGIEGSPSRHYEPAGSA